MARIIVPGKNVTLKVWKTDAYYPVACLVNVMIWLSEQYDDTSTPDSGRYVTRAPANKGEWGVNIEAVTVIRDLTDEFFFTWEFFLEAVRSNGVDIELTITDEGGATKIYRGFVYMPYNEISGLAGDVSRSNIELIGSGGLDFAGTATGSTYTTMRKDWIASAGQTEFQDNALIGLTVDDLLYVHREGEDKYKPVAGVPTNREVQLNAVDGKLVFLIESDEWQYVYCIIRV